MGEQSDHLSSGPNVREALSRQRDNGVDPAESSQVRAQAVMTDEIHHRYPPSITTPATARRDVADYLRGRAAPELVETVVLLVDELVTNSLAHAGGDVELRARLTDGTLQVEVYDGSDTLPRQQERDIRGHGLDIVD